MSHAPTVTDPARPATLPERARRWIEAGLVLGLFAEICIEMIRIPNTVIYTGDVDDYLVVAGSLMIGLGALLMVRHAVALLLMRPGKATH